MTITLTKKEETNIEINVPSFWRQSFKSYKESIAILSEDKLIYTIVFSDGQTIVKSGHPDVMKSEINDFVLRFTPCTKQAFMEDYMEILDRLIVNQPIEEEI
jgi:hypothetical protein